MIENHTSKIIDAARRQAEMRPGPGEPSAPEIEDDGDFVPDTHTEAYSMVSADRQRKVMVKFCWVNGNMKALPYSYLAGADFNPSEGIKLDFTAYEVAISGRNLLPVFEGLVAQRVAVVRAMDELQAEAEYPDGTTVVTRIEIKPVD